MRSIAIVIALLGCGEPASTAVVPAPPPEAPIAAPPPPPCVHDPPRPCEVREWIDREAVPRVRVQEHADGRLVHEIMSGGMFPPHETERRYVLDARGHVAEEHVTSSSGSSSVTRWTRDEHGHPLEIRVRLDGSETESFERHELTHDAEGRVVRDERWAVPLGARAGARVQRIE